MNIPVIKKEEDGSDEKACQAVCVLMALAYYDKININGTNISDIKREFYGRCGASQMGKHVFSWAGLLGAVSYEGIYAALLSKNPENIIGNLRDEQEWYELNQKGINDRILSMINKCHNDNKIQLIQWNSNRESEFELLREIVNNKRGVCIPTLKWNNEQHSIVIKEINNKVSFNNPNLQDISELEIKVFKEKWFHDDTDDDLIIISTEEIKFDNYLIE